MFHLGLSSSRKFAHLGVIIALILVTILPLFVQSATPTLAQGAQDDGIGTPKFKNEPLGTGVQHTASTVPYWSSSFPYGNTTYPYTMVGTDPSVGPGTTTVPVVIVPLKFVFADGAVLDGSTRVGLTVASPIFQTAGFQSGFTQYGDAIQRAEFWNTGGQGAYHVLLAQPSILATQIINVPQTQGFARLGSVSHALIGRMDYNWFSSRLKNLMGQLHIDSRSLVLFGTYNIFLYEGNNPNNCCVLGYHGATSSANGNGTQQIQTYMFASYIDPLIFRSPFIQDIHALSHELSEWMNDPFVNNIVPPWSTPTAPQYGCTSYLETGDPVVGIGFTVTLNGTTYHPEDEVYFSWFAREVPSRALFGYYTYLNTFLTPATGC